jgi:hypothetical protein
LVKGGHLRGLRQAVDILFDGREESLLEAPAFWDFHPRHRMHLLSAITSSRAGLTFRKRWPWPSNTSPGRWPKPCVRAMTCSIRSGTAEPLVRRLLCAVESGKGSENTIEQYGSRCLGGRLRRFWRSSAPKRRHSIVACHRPAAARAAGETVSSRSSPVSYQVELPAPETRTVLPIRAGWRHGAERLRAVIELGIRSCRTGTTNTLDAILAATGLAWAIGSPSTNFC